MKEVLLPSLYSQTYGDFHHIITYETEEMKEAIVPHLDMTRTTLCKVFPVRAIPGLFKSFYYRQFDLLDDLDVIDPQYSDGKVRNQPNWEGGRTEFAHFPYNLYMIRAEKKVTPGWVMYLDDDDRLYSPDALAKLNAGLLDPNSIYFIRVKRGHGIWPLEYALKHVVDLGTPPALGLGFQSSTFVFHSNFIEFTAWDEWAGGDWKTIQSLCHVAPKRGLIDEIIAEITPDQGYGK